MKLPDTFDFTREYFDKIHNVMWSVYHNNGYELHLFCGNTCTVHIFKKIKDDACDGWQVIQKLLAIYDSVFVCGGHSYYDHHAKKGRWQYDEFRGQLWRTK